MGSPSGELGHEIDEAPRTVVLTRNYIIEDHEVTQAEYEEVMHSNPSRHAGADRPVENVTWFDAIAYCNARSALAGLTQAYTISGESVTWDRESDGYRLLTEAEWERSCRAGSATAFANGPDHERGVRGRSGPGRDRLVLRKCRIRHTPREDEAAERLEPLRHARQRLGVLLGLVRDRERPDLGRRRSGHGVQRVIRGGSWYYYARDCRSASRAPYWPNSKDDIVGFRVARTIR